jgi:hypothetical protein
MNKSLKYKKNEIVYWIIIDHNEIKLEINSKENQKKTFKLMDIKQYTFDWSKGQWRMEISAAAVESNMKVSHETKNRIKTLSSDTTPRHLNEIMYSRTWWSHLHTHVYCSTIYNNHALEETQISDNWWMD